MVVSVPPVCNKPFFTQGLSVSDWEKLITIRSYWTQYGCLVVILLHIFQISSIQQLANTAAQLTTLSMINFILKRANKNIEYLLEKSVWHNSKGYTLDMMEELLQQYREALSKVWTGNKYPVSIYTFHHSHLLMGLYLLIYFRFCLILQV